MIAQAEVFKVAVTLLRDLSPYEQCRHIVQMVYDGTFDASSRCKELLYRLVDSEIDASRH